MSISISRSGDTVILGVGEQLIVGNRHELKEALLEATRPAYAEYVRRTAALIPFVL